LGSVAKDVRGAVKDLGPFPAPLAMNVIPWAGSLKEDGYSSENSKCAMSRGRSWECQN
jgi:Aspartate-semialdehyde dehydrogenase